MSPQEWQRAKPVLSVAAGLVGHQRARLGVTLFELVTGQRPFQEPSFALLTVAILATTPPLPSSIATDCPASLDRVIARALEKDPKRRYQSARELARDVRAVLGDIDIATQEIGRTPVSDTPWFQSRILTVVATVIAIVIILTFSGFVTSTIYGSPLGLTIQSQGESPAWWPVWGLRSLVFPLALMGFWITVLLVLRELYKTAAARSALLQRWSRPIRTLSQHGRSLPSTTLAAGLLVAHVMTVGASLWWFGDILTGINSFVVESGDLSALSRANVGQHQLYRSIHSVLLLVFGIAWYRLLKLRTERGERVWDTTMIAGLMVVVITLFFVVLPYRLLVHSEGERVTHHADR